MTVKTQSKISNDLRLAARQGLLPAGGNGWLAGFGNMFSKEMGEWFRTRRWLWQLLIWVIIINGVIALTIWVLPLLGQEETLPMDIQSLFMYFSVLSMTGTIGVIILAQDEIIQEKLSGTAAWILSKPAGRSSFILTKLLSNAINALVFIVLIPGLVALVLIYLGTRQVLPLLPFLAGAGVIFLPLFFYISLVILLGAVFESRGPVMGIAFGVMFGGMLLKNYIPQILYFLPLAMEGTALAVTQRMPLQPMLIGEMISTITLSILFILVALWLFQRTEL